MPTMHEAAFNELAYQRSARPQTAPMYRSKLANIFGTRLAEPGMPLTPGEAGFLATQNGATMMTPRGAVAGMALRQPAPPTSPRGWQSQRPAPSTSPRVGPAAPPRGGYSTLGAVDVAPRSPRSVAAHATRAFAHAAPHTAAYGNSPRAAHMAREDEIRALVAHAQGRIALNAQRGKMKRLLQSVANDKEEVPIEDLLLTAELANVPLTEAQKELYFATPYANHFTSTWEPNSARSRYGLECAPRSVKWRAFNDALQHAKLQSAEQVAGALDFYAKKEAAAVAEAKRRDEEAKALAASRAAASGRSVEAMKGISDEQLRMVHKLVKQRLSTQFAEIRTAFRAFDKDHSGNISASECTDALMSLNVGVPRKFIDHLVNVADYDRDGEINYAEFARILTADDITTIKKAGAEEEGLVQKTTEYYKPGITKTEMRNSQMKIRDMLHERGGLTKMFRAIDEDKSGTLSRQEVRQLIMSLNLESIVRPAIVEELINLMDADGDDAITYKEFARVCTSDDVFDMQAVREAPPEQKAPKKLTKKQAKRAMGFV